MVRQKSMARKVQLVNKFAAVANNWLIWSAKNIMTGLNVAFRIPGDSFVPEKIDNKLAASASNFSAGISWTIFIPQGREKK